APARTRRTEDLARTRRTEDPARTRRTEDPARTRRIERPDLVPRTGSRDLVPDRWTLASTLARALLRRRPRAALPLPQPTEKMGSTRPSLSAARDPAPPWTRDPSHFLSPLMNNTSLSLCCFTTNP
ncbi:hypothetical protein PRIPAC_76440, partial [Pristionchus pacificus]